LTVFTVNFFLLVDIIGFWRVKSAKWRVFRNNGGYTMSGNGPFSFSFAHSGSSLYDGTCT
ncbi:hypothetical protein, partial [Fictibacillus fluitans]